MGRRPLPKKVHDARGNAGKRKHPANPEPRVGLPQPPQSVSEDKLALAEWNRVAPELLRLQLITHLDAAVLGSYCVRVARAEQLSRLAGPLFARFTEAKLLSPGKSGLQINPAVEIALRLEKDALAHIKEARACMCEMGFTPASRNRLHAGTPESSEETAREKDFRDLEGG
jgi:P27 family predicted phage terminase small subunit